MFMKVIFYSVTVETKSYVCVSIHIDFNHFLKLDFRSLDVFSLAIDFTFKVLMEINHQLQSSAPVCYRIHEAVA